MNRSRTLQTLTFYEGCRKHSLYPDVGQDQWSYMDSHPDWPHPNPRWVNVQHNNERSRRDLGSSMTLISSSQYSAYPLERPDQHIRQGRSASYRSPVSPPTPSHELLLPAYYQPAPRCASQPNRMRDECLPSGWPEPEADRARRESQYQNDMDYQLFVEATSGLSPDASHHWSFEFPPTWRREQQQTQNQWPNLRRETPYGNLSLAQHSQPLHSTPNLPIRQPAEQPPLYNARPVSEYWQPSPEREIPDSQPRLETLTPIPTWQPQEDYDMSNPSEDELPDYAQSQAEMLDRSRREAKQRAEELQRRWRLRHSR